MSHVEGVQMLYHRRFLRVGMTDTRFWTGYTREQHM